MRTWQYLVEQRRRLVGDKGRTPNRLIDALKQYFPQALEWFKDKDTVVFCDFLSRWPTLKQAKHALAFKWIRILYRCWQDRTPYDESTYLNVLKRRGSPLLSSIAATP